MNCKSCGKEKIGRYIKNLCEICYYTQWRENNRIKCREYDKNFYKNNKEKESIKFKQWVANNKEYDKSRQKIWKNNNKEHLKIYQQINKEKFNNRILKRLRNDINYKLRMRLSARICMAVKNQGTKKSYKTLNLIGCNIKEMRDHLEKQFDKNMSWKNYGFYGWHLEHKIPCDAFDLSKEEEQLKCFHYTNYQPMWCIENWSKGAKI